MSEAFDVSVKHSFDPAEGVMSEPSISFYPSLVSSGLIKVLGANNLQTFVTIALCQDETGRCKVDMERTSAELGLSPLEFRRHIKQLLDVRWGDYPLLTWANEDSAAGTWEFYIGKVPEKSVSPAPDPDAVRQAVLDRARTTLAQSDEVTTQERNTTKKTAKKGEKATDPRIHTFVDRYFELYREKYGVSPKESVGMMGKRIKELPADFTIELLLQAIERYMSLQEAFVKNNSHSFGIFLNRLPALVGEILHNERDVGTLPSADNVLEEVLQRQQTLGITDEQRSANQGIIHDLLGNWRDDQ